MTKLNMGPLLSCSRSRFLVRMALKFWMVEKKDRGMSAPFAKSLRYGFFGSHLPRVSAPAVHVAALAIDIRLFLMIGDLQVLARRLHLVQASSELSDSSFFVKLRNKGIAGIIPAQNPAANIPALSAVLIFGGNESL